MENVVPQTSHVNIYYKSMAMKIDFYYLLFFKLFIIFG